MSLINGRNCRRPGYGFQDQVVVIVVLACLLGHLALFQLVDASTQSSSSSSSLPLGNGNDNASQKGNSRGQAVIASVPKEDRGMFVVYHLAKALTSIPTQGYGLSPRADVGTKIPQNKSLAFKNIRTYDTFSTDLLEWTTRTFGWSQFDVYTLVRRYKVLCTSKGLCFNPNDIGSMCCPF